MPLPEPIHAPLAAVGCARVISEGWCPKCYSGRQWLDHIHYICASEYWNQLAAYVVDPVSKAPGSQLHHGRETRAASRRWAQAEGHVALLLELKPVPGIGLRTKAIANGGGGERFPESSSASNV